MHPDNLFVKYLRLTQTSPWSLMFPELVQLPGYKIIGTRKEKHFDFWHENRRHYLAWHYLASFM